MGPRSHGHTKYKTNTKLAMAVSYLSVSLLVTRLLGYLYTSYCTRKPTTKTENQSEVIEEWCALYLAGPLKTNDLENLCTNRENLCTNLKTLHKRPWRTISPAAPHRLFILSPRFQTTVA